MKKAFFLDRDGVININKGHIKSFKSIMLYPGINQAFRYIKKNDYLIIIITNQSAVGRGLIDEKMLNQIHERLIKKISRRKNYIDDIFYCPHHPKFGVGKYKKKCLCRKPKNKMIEDAIIKWGISRKHSFMIGDNLSDYLAAKKSKIRFHYKKNINFFNQVKSMIS